MTLHQQKRETSQSGAETAPKTGTKTGALQDWVRALEATAAISANPQRILSSVIAEIAQRQPEAPALISERETLSYRTLAKRVNRYARWALAQNLGKGDAVALIMPNCPEYIAIWLGITSVGGVVSLVNTNLRDASLAHCINIVAPKHIVVAKELIRNFRSAVKRLAGKPEIWSHGSDDFTRIDREVENFSGAPLTPTEQRDVTIADRALHIYTSGTTGLPKAANVSHYRVMQWSLWFAGLMNTGPDDRMYDCLPMYHSVGGVVATGALLTRGGSVVIREKFSATDFWSDITRWDCTLFQYIGELCRYLLNTEPPPRHRLRLACGNGLRADVWEKFQKKFQIPRILEFYAATEANFSLYNVEGKAGAIGRIPPFLKHRFPLALVKFDHALGEPPREGNGRCIRCAAGETGEALGRIQNGNGEGAAAFEGYTDGVETERKILRDVFEPGDAWFRTGDLMKQDANGFFYFVDRTGDTFRWKGENVSASEVAAALTEFPGITEAVVYGVAVPGTEGAAGMAAITTEGALDLEGLRTHLASRLPAYAQPLFLRIQESVTVTSTFKHHRSALIREGFDPATTSDPIYLDDPPKGSYVRLNQDHLKKIRSGAIRF
jgi:fatty-acyl-CoA synthase